MLTGGVLNPSALHFRCSKIIFSPQPLRLFNTHLYSLKPNTIALRVLFWITATFFSPQTLSNMSSGSDFPDILALSKLPGFENFPLQMPPTGVSPNLVNPESRAYQYYIAAAMCYVLIVIFASIRFYTCFSAARRMLAFDCGYMFKHLITYIGADFDLDAYVLGLVG